MKTAKPIEHRIIEAKYQFRRSCDQIILINQTLRSLNHWYRKSKTANMKSFRYPLRLRLATVEGIRNIYYDYAKLKAEEVQSLREALLEESGADSEHENSA